jgi:ferredoxin
MRIVVDHDKCTGLGICESIADNVFEVGEDGQVVLLTEIVPEGSLDAVQQAVDGCPTGALRLVP